MSVAQPLPVLAHPDAEPDAQASHIDETSGVAEKKTGYDKEDPDVLSNVRPVAPDQFDSRYETSRWEIWAYYAYYVGMSLSFSTPPLFEVAKFGKLAGNNGLVGLFG